MRITGMVVRWDAARQFGFIRAPGGGADAFFHVRDLLPGAAFEPREGIAVTFDVIHVGGKGPRAVAVHLPGAQAARDRSAPRRRSQGPHRVDGTSPSQAVTVLLLTLLYAAALIWAVRKGAVPWWVLPTLTLANLFTFFAYWRDKHAARVGSWRTPEGTLHFWALAGGWPLAWVAQQVLRHKSSKREFLQVYWITVLLHLGGVGYLLWQLARSAG